MKAGPGNSHPVSVAGLFAVLLLMSICLPLHAATPTPASEPSQGEALFAKRCAACHTPYLGSPGPSQQVLAKFPPRTIVHALTVGLMREQGFTLTGDHRRQIAEYLTGSTIQEEVASSSTGRCKVADKQAMSDPSAGPGWNGWGNAITNASFQPAEAAGVTPENVGDLTLKWAFGFADSFSAWSQPVVASGRLFVGSQGGVFHSLSAETGCIHWEFSADAGIRTAASVITFDPQATRLHGARYGVLFGDMAGTAYALDAETGALLWKTTVDSHPRARITGSPMYHQGRYLVPMSSWSTITDPEERCCTFRGSLSALDVRTGKVLWKRYTVPTEATETGRVTQSMKPILGPSGAAIWAPPLVDEKRGLVYVGTGNTYTGEATHSSSILALDLESGDLKWSRQLTADDVWLVGCLPSEIEKCVRHGGLNYDIGSPPMLVRANRNGKPQDLIVVGQKSGMAYALDPDREGEIVWRYRAGEGGTGGGIIWGSAVLGSTAFFPLSDITSHKPGGLHAVDVATGEARWVAPAQPLLCGSVRYGCSAAQPVGISVVPGVVFAGSIDGGFRAYSTDDGKVLWLFDTDQEFVTVNGVPAHGGSLSGVGPTIVNGMVFVNSGYGTNGGRPGNVLLAFSLE